MSVAGAAATWSHDVPVCFPGHSCVDYSPLEGYAINITSELTPFSAAIGVACFVVLGVALLLVAFGLRPRARRPLRAVALLVALILAGSFVASIARLRLSAIAVIFGLEGPGSPDLYGAWQLVEVAGRAMTLAGTTGLALTAAIAVTWARNITRGRRTRPDASDEVLDARSR